MVPFNYSFQIAIHLAIKFVETIDKMHSKGFIHNDLKLDNILLDVDEEDGLFPVLCDFGIVHVSNSASVIQGFKVINCKAGTPQYCAPEVLSSMSNSRSIVSPC